MKILTLLCILVLHALAEDILSRVERAPSKRCPSIDIDNGNVKYRRQRTRVNFKCNDKYILYGAKTLDCRDGTWSDQPPVCIRNGCTSIDVSHIKNIDAIEDYDGALLHFTCEESYQLFGLKEIHCDGKIWNGAPPTCLAPSKITECQFEKDLCGWTQDGDDQRDWVRTIGPTQTQNTGPKYDHTYMEKKTGHYLYFESSSPTIDGDMARLRSPMYPKDLSQRCFEFWYHILGPEEQGHNGSLKVFIVGESETLADKQPMFYKEGNQGDEWHKGNFYINTMVESFQIVIVATRKLGHISDIAVDDLRLYDCNATAVTTNITTLTTELTIPDTSPTEPVKGTSMASTAKTSTAVISSIKSTTTSVTPSEKPVPHFSSTTRSSPKYTTPQNVTETSKAPTTYNTKAAVNQTVGFNVTGHSETQAALSTKSPTTTSTSQSEKTKFNSTTATRGTTAIKSSSSYTFESTADGRFTTEQTTTTNSSTSIIAVSVQKSRRTGDEAIRPLMIGLGVGVVAGLIIIVVVAWVCFRRKKLYVSRYEDELKPITKSASSQSLNDSPYYHDEFESES